MLTENKEMESVKKEGTEVKWACIEWYPFVSSHVGAHFHCSKKKIGSHPLFSHKSPTLVFIRGGYPFKGVSPTHDMNAKTGNDKTI